MQEIVVPVGIATTNLANFLKKSFPIGYIRKLFRKNGVRLNGRRAHPTDPIEASDRIQLYIPFQSPNSKPARSLAPNDIEIIYEDESLLVLDKPAGLAVHEGTTVSRRDSLAGFIERKYPEQKFRPLLAHRLDKDTSGLLLLAKNEKTLAQLEDQFEKGKVQKEYLCLVVGRLPNDQGRIDFSLPGREGKLVRAVTGYRAVKRFAATTLVHAHLETGRLHQIRLHFAKLGYPVVMDDQHGNFNFNKRFRKEYGLKRQFLHAQKLAVTCAGKRHSWTAPLPDDLAKILRRVESEAG